MKKTILLLGALWLVGTSAALAAGPPNRQCLTDSRDAVLACREECTNTFRNSRFLCRDVDTACGRICLGSRENCIETATEPLDTCLDTCRDSLRAAKDVCAQTCQDQTCMDGCVDTAQVDGFTCRDTCRENFRADGGLRNIEACRTDFRGCVMACPPAGGPQ